MLLIVDSHSSWLSRNFQSIKSFKKRRRKKLKATLLTIWLEFKLSVDNKSMQAVFWTKTFDNISAVITQSLFIYFGPFLCVIEPFVRHHCPVSMDQAISYSSKHSVDLWEFYATARSFDMNYSVVFL